MCKKEGQNIMEFIICNKCWKQTDIDLLSLKKCWYIEFQTSEGYAIRFKISDVDVVPDYFCDWRKKNMKKEECTEEIRRIIYNGTFNFRSIFEQGIQSAWKDVCTQEIIKNKEIHYVEIEPHHFQYKDFRNEAG